jgi:hypothetical protein
MVQTRITLLLVCAAPWGESELAGRNSVNKRMSKELEHMRAHLIVVDL